ncbi:MAG: hypothetical protein WC480_03690, partial [Patescibacteria group bacterium]
LIDNKYTRQVVISSVNRDENCDITPSASIDDPDSKLVTVTVSWQGQQQALSKTMSSHLMAWNNPTNCMIGGGGGGGGGQAGRLSLNISGAVRQEYIQWLKLIVTIDGVKIKNISTQPVTVDKVQVYMDKPGMSIFYFYMNGSIRWGWFGPGSPSGAKPSGTILNISDRTIQPSEEVTIKMHFFTSNYGAVVFSVNFIMADGTETRTDDFTI